MVANVTANTVRVVTAKVALFDPAARVTLAGTVAAEVLLLVSVTTAPPVGAALLNVTVPVEDAPPSTVGGLKETEATVTVAGFTVIVTVAVFDSGPPALA
jgi:hypothetical protein